MRLWSQAQARQNTTSGPIPTLVARKTRPNRLTRGPRSLQSFQALMAWQWSKSPLVATDPGSPKLTHCSSTRHHSADETGILQKPWTSHGPAAATLDRHPQLHGGWIWQTPDFCCKRPVFSSPLTVDACHYREAHTKPRSAWNFQRSRGNLRPIWLQRWPLDDTLGQ